MNFQPHFQAVLCSRYSLGMRIAHSTVRVSTITFLSVLVPPRHRHIYLHMLGYLLMLAVRVWFTSFDPVFMSFTYNNIATALGIVLATFLYCNDCRTPIVPEGSKELNRVNSSKELNSEKLSKPLLGTARGPGLVVTAVGFGALLFLTQLLFGDVSVVSRWAVACYPNRGPYPYPWR